MTQETALLEDLRWGIQQSVEQACLASAFLRKTESLAFLEAFSRAMVAIYREDKKILVAGNGGSLCDAMHFAEELSGQFRTKRKALSAIALGDPGHLTCVANDMGFSEVFARGVEAHGRRGDLLVVLTTSGRSLNLIRAVEEAKRQEMRTVAFLGKGGGGLKGQCDLEWIVDGFIHSDRIQEAHMTAIHIAIEFLEKLLFHELEVSLP